MELPKELNAHVQSIRAFAEIHNLLATGLYPHSHFTAVNNCVLFVRSLHDQAIKVASEHPESDLVPELKAYKEAQANLPKVMETCEAAKDVETANVAAQG